MKFKGVRVRNSRLPWAMAILLILLCLMLTNLVSASSMNDELMWVTVCHTSVGDPDQTQTMVLYWSALDKCLSHFNDFIGACP